MSIETGGPAFPTTQVDGGSDGIGIKDGIWHFPGMTLRDYFAAHANEKDIARHQTDPRTGRLVTREVAKYRYASAMLKARGQE